jgi:hypothetical protein
MRRRGKKKGCFGSAPASEGRSEAARSRRSGAGAAGAVRRGQPRREAAEFFFAIREPEFEAATLKQMKGEI